MMRRKEREPAKSGVDRMLKSMLGIDVDELTQFGNQVGQLLADFRSSLIRIEERMERIEGRLEWIERTLMRSADRVSHE